MVKLGRPKGSKEKWNVGSRKYKCVGARFWEKVKKGSDDECWEWQANIVYGYGMFTVNKKQIGAHQWSWKYFNGDIPKGMFVCHKCDNRKCVNPKHLFLGTAKDNAVDRENKGRGVVPDNRGERHGMAKLTGDLVKLILEMSDAGYNQTEIAKQIKIVNRRTVGKVIRRISWKHMDGSN